MFLAELTYKRARLAGALDTGKMHSQRSNTKTNWTLLKINADMPIGYIKHFLFYNYFAQHK